MVDGVLPPARARVVVTRVHSNHARAEELTRLEMDDDVDEETADDAEDDEREDDDPHLGSRDNFWGN
jgi:hypothetical protein